MPRPGRNIHETLLASGRELYPHLGCAGLSIRALTQHAGVNLGMFHYHFRTKDAFLEALLQQLYDEMFGQLSGRAGEPGPAVARLREALLFLARFSRDNAAVLGRVFADATGGQAAAASFVRANAPRHLKLLLALMQQAEKEGALAPIPALQRFVFVMGAVAMPIVVVPRIGQLGVAPALLGRQLKAQVTSDAAIAQRVDLALGALKTGIPA
jgi:AcrR family transcriptional regulator